MKTRDHGRCHGYRSAVKLVSCASCHVGRGDAAMAAPAAPAGCKEFEVYRRRGHKHAQQWWLKQLLLTELLSRWCRCSQRGEKKPRPEDGRSAGVSESGGQLSAVRGLAAADASEGPTSEWQTDKSLLEPISIIWITLILLLAWFFWCTLYLIFTTIFLHQFTIYQTVIHAQTSVCCQQTCLLFTVCRSAVFVTLPPPLLMCFPEYVRASFISFLPPYLLPSFWHYNL